MKPHIDIAHTGTIGDESRVRMSFDENSIAHLMGVLTDLYSDPEMAVIREYSTNAWDAHLCAGNTDPILVSLPTRLNPVFVVKDYGTGMSLEDITQNFSKYGWSSKRDNDTEVGMLGLGCKSALTYTSQFTLVSTCNHLQVTVLVTREADGAGAVQIIDTMPTDAPNGVEVRIPVKDATHFNKRVQDFFRFWEPGTVLINGVAPTPYKASMVLDPDVWLVNVNETETDFIIMGQVAYPVRYPVEPLVANMATRAIVRVPVGCIDFTPSREGLQMTKRTEETLDDIRTFIKDQVHAKAQQEIEAAPTPAEALRVAHKWRYNFRHDYTYRGKDIPNTIDLIEDRSFRWNIHYATSERGTKISYLRPDDALRAIYIVGHRGNGMLATTKERIKLWAKNKGIDTQGHSIVIATPEMVGLPWLNDTIQVSFDELRKIDLGQSIKSDPGTGQYKILARHGAIRYTDVLKPTAVWLQAAMRVDRSMLMPFMHDHDVDVVVVGMHQQDKFKRENPHIISIQEYLARQARQALAAISPDDRFYVVNSYAIDRTSLKLLDPARVPDPELRDVVKRIRRLKKDGHRAFNDLSNMCRLVGATIPKTTSTTDLLDKVKAMIDRYPLLDNINSYSFTHGDDSQHFYQYINALYTLSNNQITYLP